MNTENASNSRLVLNDETLNSRLIMPISGLGEKQRNFCPQGEGSLRCTPVNSNLVDHLAFYASDHAAHVPAQVCYPPPPAMRALIVLRLAHTAALA